jgi:sulfur-oxidizing protein SoxX|nr:sulfur oxidation c-type cytochrome SoxX [Polynucleobacter sp. 30F-ANTBAC]
MAQSSFEKEHAASFKEKGIAKLDRLNRDETQVFCSDPAALAGKGDPKKREAIEKANMATIKQPSDGKYLGDWKVGETVAQSGRGATWSDKAGTPNGGGCYNCHQIDKKEISHGNIGPSLWNYGKVRGNTEAVVQYTWGKIYNAKAYNACSNMPRMGHYNLLTEQQMRDVMALLLDPASPVNQ